VIKNYLLKYRPVVGLLLAGILTVASAADGRWTEGFGQGNLEYFIDAQDIRLYIGCPTESGSSDAASSVNLLSAKTGTSAGKFTVKVGGHVYEGPFEADSRAGANNFIQFLADLRKTDVVVTYSGKTATFPKSNVAAVVPLWGTKKFACNVG
jgi:hypothetical protein